MTLPPLTPTAEPVAQDPTRAPFNSPSNDRMCLAGLWLAVLSAGLCLLGPFGDRVVASQSEYEVAFVPGSFIGIGIAGIVLFGLAALLPYAWARLTGIGLMPVFGLIYGGLAGGARTDKRFDADRAIDIGRGGTILISALLVIVLALTLALIGAPRIGRRLREGEVAGTSGYAITGMVLSICGLATAGLTGALGIAFSIAGLDDVQRGGGRRQGRGMAVAGLVVGLVFVVFGALFAIVFAGFADPTWNEQTNAAVGLWGAFD